MNKLIRNSGQAKQGIDFGGFENGKIHPSDIDAVLEFNNDILILIEVKREGNDIPKGQELLLERICDSWHTGKCVVLFATHKLYDTSVDIPMSECQVKKVYHNSKWHLKEVPLKDALNAIGKNWQCPKLNFE